MTTAINSVTVADPYDLKVEHRITGRARQIFNGKWVVDRPGSGEYRWCHLKWRELTTAEKDAIVTQAKNVKTTAASCTFPDGASFSAKLAPNTFPVTNMTLGVGGATRWQVELQLIEEAS